MHIPLLKSIAAESIPRIRDFGGQECSNIAWSVSTLQMVNSPLLEALAASARPPIAALPRGSLT